jgi:hypothetical protein
MIISGNHSNGIRSGTRIGSGVADPILERIARLQREAEVLAAMNHPNISAIHGLEGSIARSSEGQADSRRSSFGVRRSQTRS